MRVLSRTTNRSPIPSLIQTSGFLATFALDPIFPQMRESRLPTSTSEKLPPPHPSSPYHPTTSPDADVMSMIRESFDRSIEHKSNPLKLFDEMKSILPRVVENCVNLSWCHEAALSLIDSNFNSVDEYIEKFQNFTFGSDHHLHHSHHHQPYHHLVSTSGWNEVGRLNGGAKPLEFLKAMECDLMRCRKLISMMIEEDQGPKQILDLTNELMNITSETLHRLIKSLPKQWDRGTSLSIDHYILDSLRLPSKYQSALPQALAIVRTIVRSLSHLDAEWRQHFQGVILKVLAIGMSRNFPREGVRVPPSGGGSGGGVTSGGGGGGVISGGGSSDDDEAGGRGVIPLGGRSVDELYRTDSVTLRESLVYNCNMILFELNRDTSRNNRVKETVRRFLKTVNFFLSNHTLSAINQQALRDMCEIFSSKSLDDDDTYKAMAEGVGAEQVVVERGVEGLPPSGRRSSSSLKNISLTAKRVNGMLRDVDETLKIIHRPGVGMGRGEEVVVVDHVDPKTTSGEEYVMVNKPPPPLMMPELVKRKLDRWARVSQSANEMVAQIDALETRVRALSTKPVNEALPPPPPSLLMPVLRASPPPPPPPGGDEPLSPILSPSLDVPTAQSRRQERERLRRLNSDQEKSSDVVIPQISVSSEEPSTSRNDFDGQFVFNEEVRSLPRPRQRNKVNEPKQEVVDLHQMEVEQQDEKERQLEEIFEPRTYVRRPSHLDLSTATSRRTDRLLAQASPNLLLPSPIPILTPPMPLISPLPPTPQTPDAMISPIPPPYSRWTFPLPSDDDELPYVDDNDDDGAHGYGL